MHLDVLAIGNALVDVVSEGTDSKLVELGLIKGSMTLIDSDQALQIYSRIGPSIETSGGSAANTMVGLAQAGHQVGFIGRVCDDELGSVFVHDLKACGVEFRATPAADGLPTGRCFVVVTPDGERTMATSLGASSHINPSDVDESHLMGTRVLYLEGYLWDLEDAKSTLRQAAENALSHGTSVAFSLSDPFCVERHREEFIDFILSSVDLVFANEDEALQLSDSTNIDAAMTFLGTLTDHAVVTRGAAGCVVMRDGILSHYPSVPVRALVDTTGAGDAFAAGYLDGMLSEASTQQCAQLGAERASAVLEHFGARLLDVPPKDQSNTAAGA